MSSWQSSSSLISIERLSLESSITREEKQTSKQSAKNCATSWVGLISVSSWKDQIHLQTVYFH